MPVAAASWRPEMERGGLAQSEMEIQVYTSGGMELV
jgi:hypothetical protein